MVQDWNRIYCVVTSVCVFRFVYTLSLRRNSKVKKISSDSESNSFANSSRISDQNILEEDQEDVEESLTRKLTSRVNITWRFYVTFSLHDSNAIFEGKIGQLCMLIKSKIFIIGNSNFEIVYFKCYIFIICGKKFSLRRHFNKCEPNLEKKFLWSMSVVLYS